LTDCEVIGNIIENPELLEEWYNADNQRIKRL
jgi:RecB family endonuclease NucS